MRWLLLVMLGLGVSCGSPTKGTKKPGEGPIVICDGPDCEDGDAAAMADGCGFATCDDENACTVDSGAQNPLTCRTSCTYEIADECATAPGEAPRCSRDCRAPTTACVEVATTRDADGCVTACDFAPITACRSLDGCCPGGCTSAVDSDCDAGTPVDHPPVTDPPVVGPSCDPNVEGTCPNTTPYCVDGACRECVGAGDCAVGDLCIDGGCSAPPSCGAGTSRCPADYNCTNGVCEAPVGAACNVNDPGSCPDGLFCDSATQTCVNAGGDVGCGFCNPDCTCDGNLSCNGFMCEGCSLVDPNYACPEGMLCLEPLITICIPFG